MEIKAIAVGLLLMIGVSGDAMAQDEGALIGEWFGTLDGISYEFEFANNGQCAIQATGADGKKTVSTQCEYVIYEGTVIQWWVSNGQAKTNQAAYDLITDRFMVLDGIPLHKTN